MARNGQGSQSDDRSDPLNLFTRRPISARAKSLRKLAVRSAPLDEPGWEDFAHEAQLVALAKRLHTVLHAAFFLRVLRMAEDDRARTVREIEASYKRADAQLADLGDIPEAAEAFLRSDLWGHDDLRALAKRALDSLPEDAE